MAKTFKNRPNQAFNIGGNVVWNSRSAAVVAVVIAIMDCENVTMRGEKYVLINKRGSGVDNSGKFCCVCGYLDFDETGPEAFEREIWEETGVDIEEIKRTKEIIEDFTEQPFYVNTDPKENRQNVSLSYGLIFKTNTFPKTTDENSEPNEVAEIKWINVKDVDKYDFAFNHDKRIKMFLNKISK